MTARKPDEPHLLFVKAFNARDLASLTALYESDAGMVAQPGQQAVIGIEALREVLQGFLALKGTIDIQTKSVIQAGDIALLRSQWHLTGTGPDGQPIEMSHNDTEVVRRQLNGSWRYVIDHSFGAD